MAFIKKNTRKISNISSINPSNTINIDLKSGLISDGHSTANFERLLYIGCPNIAIEGKDLTSSRDNSEKINADRKEFVLKTFHIFQSMDRTVRTKINIFNEVVFIVKLMDKLKIKDILSEDLFKIYTDQLLEKYHSGTKGKTLQSKQNSIKFFIKELDPIFYNKIKNIFTSFPSDSQATLPYTDNEIKKITTALFFIYNSYSNHIEKNTKPLIFPLYEKQFSSNEKKIKTNFKKRTTSYKANSNVWKSDLSRVAYFLTCFYTGANSTSLLDIKTTDLEEETFIKIKRGIYNLRTKKSRQSGRINNINVGFTKRSKTFFERWMKISKKLNNYNDGYLFPKLINDEAIKMTTTNMGYLNKYLIELGIPALTSQRFRKTKASLIMRATESILMVSEGLNNTPETSEKHYSDGNPTTSEFSIASALYIREQTVKGIPIEIAIQESSFIFKDPIKESWIGKKLSNGLRCEGAYGEKSIELKKVLLREELAGKEDVVACHKFLECFGCVHHAIVAEVDDVWLLLSFRDIILESIARPSVNSQPSKLLNKVSNTINIIIQKIKTDYKSIYNEAYNRYIDEPHPLWQNVSDIELIKGVY